MRTPCCYSLRMGLFIKDRELQVKQDMNLLASFLRSHREQSGISQAEVAKKLGYSTPQFISNWERGLSAPPFNALKKLATIYKVDADELFKVLLETKLDEVKKDMTNKFYGELG